MAGGNMVGARRDAHTEMIETPRLLLRPWRLSDREPFRRMNGDPRVMEFFAKTLSLKESDELVERIDAHFQTHGYGIFAAELRESGAFTGFIGLSIPTFQAHFTPCVEIGWRLDPAYWNRGLATEGARAVLQYGFETLALDEIVSFTVPGNLRSRRVMEKIGMHHDAAGDFDYPGLPEGHPLRRHVLYRLARSSRVGP